MNDKITFPRLATMLADRSGRSKRFSEDFLREFFALISETLEAGESVKVKGLGTFRLSRVEPRRSVDVTTGQPMEISGHSKVVFVPAKELADAVNAPFEAFTAIEISDDADISQLFSKDEIDLQESYDQFSAETDSDVISESVETAIPDSLDTFSFKGVDDETTTLLQASSTIDEEPTPSELPTDSLQSNIPVETEDTVEAEVNIQPEANIGPEENEEPEESLETGYVAEPDATAEVHTDTVQQTADNIEATYLQNEEAPEEENPQNEVVPADEEFEAPRRGRKNWVRTLLISLGAAVVALFATFAIWYVFVTNDYKSFFNRSVAESTQPEAGFVVGKGVVNADPTTQEVSAPAEEMDDTASVVEEPEVPTVPSDALVYDTISTTRYLTTMAKAHYGNYNLWPYIYEENKNILGHPDRIRPGTPVVIPKLSKYGVDPNNKEHVEKAKNMGVEIYARYGKKI